MPCYSPITGSRTVDGKLRKPTRHSSDSVFPEGVLTVPCGQCIGCRLAHSRGWAARLVHENQMHRKSCFLTLTYDNESLPGDKSLDLKHVQNFMKALRHWACSCAPLKKEKNVICRDSQHKLSFFHCGEYGEKTLRPHYHLILYGVDFKEDRKLVKRSRHGDPLFTSESVSELWPHGLHRIGDVSFESAAYVARYVTKKITGPAKELHYWRLDTSGPIAQLAQVKPEYATMSRAQGIGRRWIEKYLTDVYPSDEVIVNGHPQSPPRFYDEYLKQTNKKLYEEVKAKRLAKANDPRKQYEETQQRQSTREQVAHARMKDWLREIDRNF